MIYSIFDIEANGLLDTVTKIHCLCCTTFNSETGEIKERWTTNYDHMRSFFQEDTIIVGHNICQYDIPLAEKILGIVITSKCIDTKALSWYLYPNRIIHGLDEWGMELGIEKPKVEDWENAPREEYIHRCQEDVKINTKLFERQWNYLRALYEGNESEMLRISYYLTYKLKCAAEQEEVKWKYNKVQTQENLAILQAEMQRKVDILTPLMPDVKLTRVMNYPKNPTKKDGSPSVIGQRWLNYLEELGLPQDHKDPITLDMGTKPGNPTSHDQLKEWLFSLGWVPDVFKYENEVLKDENGKPVKDANGKKIKLPEKRKIPQISKIGEPELTDSVVRMIEANPQVREIEGLFMVQHRIGILEGFLEKGDEQDYLKSEISGFTNTLRFKHKHPLVNLPAIYKPYGKEIRGVLIAPEGYTLCGSDVSSLEDQTKRHYMYFFDPDYVMEMSDPNFDPHLDIALKGELVTQEEFDFYKAAKKFENPTVQQKERVEQIGKQRKYGKQGNFSCTYGAFPPKIAEAANIPLALAQKIFNAYWERNFSIKEVVKNLKIKTINGQKWLKQPVSGFWYSLRYEKDAFSTCNQSTGVYVFDNWVRKVRQSGIKICFQYHDEIAFPLKEGLQEQTKQKLQKAMEEVNAEMKLNVTIGISVDFGPSYADIH